MNDDEFMHGLRKDPPAELEAGLRATLRATEEAAAVSVRPARRLRPFLAAAAGIAAVVAFSVSPALRAQAQAFLDLFRVRNFVAVSVDPTRFERLDKSK